MISRREFLKISLFASLIGFGGSLSLGALEKKEGGQVLKDLKALKGKRWAMAIDTRQFKTMEDFDKVIKACHRAHNVPEIINPLHEIKWIWIDDYKHSFPGTAEEYISKEVKERKFLLLCNHCGNPPCVRVCPVKATFKREDGITMQDMHRCIGCKFCMAGCPYGARNYNFLPPRDYIKELNHEYPTRTLGVVEKCTFCNQRIDRGMLPYCVEASEGKIIFGDLYDPNSEIRKVLSENIVIRRKVELGTQPMVFYII